MDIGFSYLTNHLPKVTIFHRKQIDKKQNKIRLSCTNQYTHHINVDAPANHVEVLVVSIFRVKHCKPKITQPLTPLIP